MAKGFGREYPRGRISGDDEGQTATAMAVDHQNKTLIIRYFKPIVWVGYGPDEAMQYLMMLAKHVSQLVGKPITVSIGDESEGGGDE